MGEPPHDGSKKQGFTSLKKISAPRTWTLTDGRSIHASLITEKNPVKKLNERVRLSGTDGLEYRVPIAQLSKSDAAFVKRAVASLKQGARRQAPGSRNGE